MKTLTEQQANELGRAIEKLLNLKENDVERFDTSIGDKTRVGLARTMIRLIDEPIFRQDIIHS